MAMGAVYAGDTIGGEMRVVLCAQCLLTFVIVPSPAGAATMLYVMTDAYFGAGSLKDRVDAADEARIAPGQRV
jgi:hypothetical protein